MYNDKRLVSTQEKANTEELAKLLASVPAPVSADIINMVKGIATFFHYTHSDGMAVMGKTPDAQERG